MIERVSFTNFKSLRRVDVDLGRFTVIVGPNGSGKTSILDGLHYLAQATQKPLGSILTGVLDPLNLKRRDTEGPMKLALSGHFHGVGAWVEIEITCNEDASGEPTWSATVTQRSGKEELKLKEPPASSLLKSLLSKSPEMTALARELGSARKLRLDVEMLAAPSYSDEETPRLAFDGKGLASVLADLAGRSPEVFQSIQDAAREVVPALERIRTRRAKVSAYEQQEIRIDGKPIPHTVERSSWGQQLVLDFKGAPDVPAPLASEGTLLVIGLLTALRTDPRPRLLLLDDIDKALHPRAQRELVAQLRKVLEKDPELQIIATSHSPYLIDNFEPQEVLITAVLPDGSTACAPLSTHPDFERWKDTTQAGELWSFVGEDWVVERALSASGHR